MWKLADISRIHGYIMRNGRVKGKKYVSVWIVHACISSKNKIVETKQYFLHYKPLRSIERNHNTASPTPHITTI